MRSARRKGHIDCAASEGWGPVLKSGALVGRSACLGRVLTNRLGLIRPLNFRFPWTAGTRTAPLTADANALWVTGTNPAAARHSARRDTNDTKSPAHDIGTIRTGVMVAALPQTRSAEQIQTGEFICARSASAYSTMVALFGFLLTLFASSFRSKSRLEAENAALRHQLIVLRRKVRGRVQLTNSDRLFFMQLYRWFPSVLKAITIVRPETLVRWHRAGFRRYWRWKSRSLGGRSCGR